MHPTRVRLLLADGHSCYRPRRTGERKRKSVRGCIVGPDIAVLSLVIVKQGENDIPGLTDNVLPKRLGPKRATKIRKFFNLSKEDGEKWIVNLIRETRMGADAKIDLEKVRLPLPLLPFSSLIPLTSFTSFYRT